MWQFLLFYLLPALPCVVHVQQTEEFAQAVMHSLGNTNPAVILDLDQTPPWEWNGWQSSVLIPATADLHEIVSSLKKLVELDEVDFIFFMTPMGQEQVKALIDKIGSLWPTTTMLIPQDYHVSYPLRLDSRLFTYKISGPSVVLFEKYQIR